MAAATPPSSSGPPVLGQPWTIPDLGLELVWVAPGSFQMGSNDGSENEKPVHAVRISCGYWIGKYEVTQGEYEALIGKNVSNFKDARNPVNCVSWSEAVAFCTKLTEREQKVGRLPAGYEYRLPTEAEWEYAARGGTQSQDFTYSGSNNVDEVAWYYGNSGDRRLDDSEADFKKRKSNFTSNKCREHPVGQKKPNELGLYDMSGNVGEHCVNWYEEYPSGTVTDPVGPAQGSASVSRGGGWYGDVAGCRSAHRLFNLWSAISYSTGLRACLAPAIPATTPAAIEPHKATPPPAAPAPALAPAATSDPAQAKLAALLDLVAADLATGKPTEALRRWQAGSAAAELKLVAEQVTAIGKTLGEAASIPQHLLESFQAEVGKTVEIELLKEKATCEVREVTAAGIKVNQIIKQGQGTAKLGRTLALGELSMQERLRRLGTGDTPELNLQRGLLALEAGRPDNARRLFETAGGALGAALVAQVEVQRAQASEAAAERALSELLRQISGSPKFDDQAKVAAAIRKRCGGDPKRRESARRLLAEFEKEGGRMEPGKTWIPVLQDALAYPPHQDWTVPDLGLELVWVAPGSFQMGSADYPPVHPVQISRGYWIGKYEVTRAEYEGVLKNNPSVHSTGASPPLNVSWDDAMPFCAKLTEREQKAGRLPQGYEYRLPTEAEWEYAARGGARSAGTTYSGSNSVDEVAWYADNSEMTSHPVGQKKPNELGLYDMTGNLSELCLDGYDTSYYANSPGTDPVNLHMGSGRVQRGGCWAYDAGNCGVTVRLGCPPSISHAAVGFRVCLAPTLPAPAP
jgi:formylglycine-generating enzyme required for sulfatase activity